MRPYDTEGYASTETSEGPLAYACYYHPTTLDIETVATVHRYWTDGADEPAFAWAVEMDDGTFAFVSGWHDFTGWDCRSGLEVFPAASLAEAIRLAPDDPRREWEGA